MYFLLNMVIFQPTMLVFGRVYVEFPVFVFCFFLCVRFQDDKSRIMSVRVGSPAVFRKWIGSSSGRKKKSGGPRSDGGDWSGGD